MEVSEDPAHRCAANVEFFGNLARKSRPFFEQPQGGNAMRTTLQPVDFLKGHAARQRPGRY